MFYGVANSGAVADGGETDFLESAHVELEDDITSDVVVLEGLDVLGALVVGQPAGDMNILPLGYEICIRETRWWIEDIRGRGRATDPIRTWHGGGVWASARTDGLPAVGGWRNEILLVSKGDWAGRRCSGRRGGWVHGISSHGRR